MANYICNTRHETNKKIIVYCSGRFMLFDAGDLIGHEIGCGHSSFKWHKRVHQVHVDIGEDNPCTSLFIEPVNWMLPLLVGNVEGKVHYMLHNIIYCLDHYLN